jgi:hypothetical protein
MRQVFETLMAGSRTRVPEAAGGSSGSRSSRALLRAKSRAVVTPEERQDMEALARRELVSECFQPLHCQALLLVSAFWDLDLCCWQPCDARSGGGGRAHG